MSSYDLLLSSGYLAFARHAGVVRAIEERGVAIDALVGTSSGALVGALWAAGHSASRIESLLGELPPWRLLGLHGALWRGAFSLAPLVTFLRRELPVGFDGLSRPLAVGVVDSAGAPRLIIEGDLPSAVAASCAIPGLFVPVTHGGHSYRDGGMADRLMVEPWRRWRPDRAMIAHVVERSAGREAPVSLDGLPVVRTPRSGASFWSLGDIGAAADVARSAALPVLESLGH